MKRDWTMRLTFFFIGLVGCVSIGGRCTMAAEAVAATLEVMDSFGAPIKHMVVHIDSTESTDAFHKILEYKGVTSFPLPAGAYRFSCEDGGNTWAVERVVEVVRPRAYVLLAVPRKEAYAIAGEGTAPAYRVAGTVVQNGTPRQGLFVRLLGVYLGASTEGRVDGAGRFSVAVRFQGDYELQVIGGGSILAHKPVRFDESTGQDVRLRVTIP